MRWLLGLLALLWASVADAGIVVHDLGSVSGSSGPTLSLTTSTTVPAKSTIIVLVYEYTASGMGSVADQVSNTYVALSAPGLCASPNNSQTSFGYECLTYAYNVTSLPSGDTITFARSSSNSTVVMNAFYLTGVFSASDPLDTGSVAETFGISSTPAITAGNQTVYNDLIVGFVSAAYAGTVSWTQDSSHAAWANPPDAVHLNSANTFGGNVVNPTLTGLTYAPTMNVSTEWAMRIFAFKPAPQSTFIIPPAVVP